MLLGIVPLTPQPIKPQSTSPMSMMVENWLAIQLDRLRVRQIPIPRNGINSKAKADFISDERKAEAADVWIETESGPPAEWTGIMDGLMVAVAPGGSPVTERPTGLGNVPELGVTLKSKLTAPPGLTAIATAEVGVIVIVNALGLLLGA